MVLDVPDLMQEVLARGQIYRFELLERSTGQSKVNKVGGTFDLGPGKTLNLLGIHYADDRPLAIEQRKISLASVPVAEHAEIGTSGPGTWLLQNVPWTEAETRISAVDATNQNAALLHIQAGAALLQIERQTWRGHDRITVVRQLFRADSYDLSAKFSGQDIARR